MAAYHYCNSTIVWWCQLLEKVAGVRASLTPTMSDKLIRRLRQILNEPSDKQKKSLPNFEEFELPIEDNKKVKVKVPRPAQYQPEPMVEPSLSEAYNEIRKQAPNIQGFTKKVRLGPTDDILGRLDIQNRINDNLKNRNPRFGPEDFEDLNLLGITNTNTKDVTLNQRLRNDSEMSPTMGHELAHVMDKDHGDGPEEVQEIIRKLRLAKIFK